MKHTKHAKLTKPNLGNFGRNEWAILGTVCGEIDILANSILEHFGSLYKTVYIDADHEPADLDNPEITLYTDKINYQRLEWAQPLNSYQNRVLMNVFDFILVNGNHAKAKKQILVIDPKKKESISRKIDRLQDIQLVIYKDGEKEIYDFLIDQIPGIQDVPSLQWDDTEKIISFLEEKLRAEVPPLNALILAGGKSQRMGKDKAQINYHGSPQQEHLLKLTKNFVDKTYLSIRQDQENTDQNVIKDGFVGLGPYGAILSAFKEQPDSAWLVIACDLPYIDEAAISYLINNRDPSKVATAFHNPETGFPDPLFTIWEPKAYMIMFQFLAQGFSCPRKVLINANVAEIELGDKKWITNVNTPEDFEKVGFDQD